MAPDRTYIREFFVDFLGSLVPGFLFTVATTLLLSWVGSFLWRSVGNLFGEDGLTVNLVSSLDALRLKNSRCRCLS